MQVEALAVQQVDALAALQVEALVPQVEALAERHLQQQVEALAV